MKPAGSLMWTDGEVERVCLCVQVQHGAVFSICRPVSSGLLSAQSQPPELPPGGALTRWLPEHTLSSQLPPDALSHGLSGGWYGVDRKHKPPPAFLQILIQC